MKRVQTGIRALTALSLAFLIGFASNAQETAPGEDPSVEEARDDVRTMANNTLQTLYARQPEAKKAVDARASYH